MRALDLPRSNRRGKGTRIEPRRISHGSRRIPARARDFDHAHGSSVSNPHRKLPPPNPCARSNQRRKSNSGRMTHELRAIAREICAADSASLIDRFDPKDFPAGRIHFCPRSGRLTSVEGSKPSGVRKGPAARARSLSRLLSMQACWRTHRCRRISTPAFPASERLQPSVLRQSFRARRERPPTSCRPNPRAVFSSFNSTASTL